MKKFRRTLSLLSIFSLATLYKVGAADEGFLIPQTGGRGTTIFIVAGAVLIVLALVFLIVKMTKK